MCALVEHSISIQITQIHFTTITGMTTGIIMTGVITITAGVTTVIPTAGRLLLISKEKINEKKQMNQGKKFLEKKIKLNPADSGIFLFDVS